MTGTEHEDPRPGSSAPGPDSIEGGTPETAATRFEQAKAATAALLVARGIAEVVHVDDANPEDGQPSSDIDLVVGALATGLLSVADLASNPATAHMVVVDGQELTAQELVDQLRLSPEIVSPSDQQALTDAARIKGLPTHPAETPTVQAAQAVRDGTDLGTLAEVRDLLPEHVTYRPMRASTWELNKASVLASTVPVLVLFDRDFSLEGGAGAATAGEELLIEALRSRAPTVYVGMLTHGAASDDDEDQLVNRIVDRGSVDPLDVIVISRRTVLDEPLRLPIKLKATLLGTALRQLRENVLTGYRDAHTDACSDIAGLGAYELSELVRAADAEGAHGADNVLRIAATTQRLRLARFLRVEPAINEALDDIRQLHDAGPTGSQLVARDVSHWSYRDRYDSAEHLSELHLPLEPGDIFEKVDPQSVLHEQEPKPLTSRYILLVQACDIAVRSDGARKGNPSMLSLARLERVDPRRVREYEHRLDGYDPRDDGKVWCVMTWDRVHFPTKALEACVFGRLGSALIVPGELAPTGLTPGWRLRHQRLDSWATKQLDTFERLATGSGTEVVAMVTQAVTGTSNELVELKASVEVQPARRIAYGLRRIGRASDGDARVMLAIVGSYTARPAADGRLFPADQASG